MLHTWQAADCSDQEPYNKNLELAMKSIKAKTLVLPGETDLYFPPEDSEYEVQHMAKGVGQCIPFPSIWGHWYVSLRRMTFYCCSWLTENFRAGGPGVSKEDVKWLDDHLKVLLDVKKWQLDTTGLD